MFLFQGSHELFGIQACAEPLVFAEDVEEQMFMEVEALPTYSKASAGQDVSTEVSGESIADPHASLDDSLSTRELDREDTPVSLDLDSGMEDDASPGNARGLVARSALLYRLGVVFPPVPPTLFADSNGDAPFLPSLAKESITHHKKEKRCHSEKRLKKRPPT